MMKKLLSLFVVLALVLAMVPAVYAEGSAIAVKVAPAAAAEIGETVEFTVTATGTAITAAQFELAIPEGLTYVAGSAKVPEGLKAALGWADVSWTEESMMWTGYNDMPADFAAGTVILTFSCVADAEGKYEVALNNFEPMDVDFEEIEETIEVVALNVTKPATPDAPTQKPTEKPTEAPTQKPTEKPSIEENPKTSNNSMVLCFALMMAASFAVLFTVLMGKKKFVA